MGNYHVIGRGRRGEVIDFDKNMGFGLDDMLQTT
jgi:hypothetical protein